MDSPDRSAVELSEDDALVPIRMVESLAYCPRQAWYRFVAGDDPINEHMERGLARHETFATAETEPLRPYQQRYRHLAVSAPNLGVSGVLDEVDIGPDVVVITEYKTARQVRDLWRGVQLQLAVQYLALCEHAASPRWHGPLLPAGVELRAYFTTSRRYRAVGWTMGLEAAARRAVAESSVLLTQAHPPAGNVGARCAQCQHEPACLPWLTPAWREAP